jgi:hypothetical protein
VLSIQHRPRQRLNRRPIWTFRRDGASNAFRHVEACEFTGQQNWFDRVLAPSQQQKVHNPRLCYIELTEQRHVSIRDRLQRLC